MMSEENNHTDAAGESGDWNSAPGIMWAPFGLISTNRTGSRPGGDGALASRSGQIQFFPPHNLQTPVKQQTKFLTLSLQWYCPETFKLRCTLTDSQAHLRVEEWLSQFLESSNVADACFHPLFQGIPEGSSPHTIDLSLGPTNTFQVARNESLVSSPVASSKKRKRNLKSPQAATLANHRHLPVVTFQLGLYSKDTGTLLTPSDALYELITQSRDGEALELRSMMGNQSWADTSIRGFWDKEEDPTSTTTRMSPCNQLSPGKRRLLVGYSTKKRPLPEAATGRSSSSSSSSSEEESDDEPASPERKRPKFPRTLQDLSPLPSSSSEDDDSSEKLEKAKSKGTSKVAKVPHTANTSTTSTKTTIKKSTTLSQISKTVVKKKTPESASASAAKQSPKKTSASAANQSPNKNEKKVETTPKFPRTVQDLPPLPDDSDSDEENSANVIVKKPAPKKKSATSTTPSQTSKTVVKAKTPESASVAKQSPKKTSASAAKQSPNKEKKVKTTPKFPRTVQDLPPLPDDSPGSEKASGTKVVVKKPAPKKKSVATTTPSQASKTVVKKKTPESASVAKQSPKKTSASAAKQSPNKNEKKAKTTPKFPRTVQDLPPLPDDSQGSEKDSGTKVIVKKPAPKKKSVATTTPSQTSKTVAKKTTPVSASVAKQSPKKTSAFTVNQSPNKEKKAKTTPKFPRTVQDLPPLPDDSRRNEKDSGPKKNKKPPAKKSEGSAKTPKESKTPQKRQKKK